MIARQANLISVPWDGYLKYFKPKKEMLEERRRMYARMLLSRFSDDDPNERNAVKLASPRPSRKLDKQETARLEAQADQDLLQATRHRKIRASVTAAPSTTGVLSSKVAN
jgi:hypothetical protein